MPDAARGLLPITAGPGAPGTPGTRLQGPHTSWPRQRGPQGRPIARPALSAAAHTPARASPLLAHTPILSTRGCGLLGSFPPRAGFRGAGQAARVGGLSFWHLWMSLVQLRHRVGVAGGCAGPTGRAAARLSAPGKRAALQKLTWIFPLFQTERISPFCARKCFCLGGGARVTPICPDFEGFHRNPG